MTSNEDDRSRHSPLSSCLRLTTSHDLRVWELKLASLGRGDPHVSVVLAGSESISNECGKRRCGHWVPGQMACATGCDPHEHHPTMDRGAYVVPGPWNSFSEALL